MKNKEKVSVPEYQMQQAIIHTRGDGAHCSYSRREVNQNNKIKKITKKKDKNDEDDKNDQHEHSQSK